MTTRRRIRLRLLSFASLGFCIAALLIWAGGLSLSPGMADWVRSPVTERRHLLVLSRGSLVWEVLDPPTPETRPAHNVDVNMAFGFALVTGPILAPGSPRHMTRGSSVGIDQ